jgi:hypothetical protein
MICHTIEGVKVKAIMVLLIILLSTPLLTMTAGAYMLAGDDFSAPDISGMMTPMGLGTFSGIPSSIGFSIPDMTLPSMLSTGQPDISSLMMPDTNVNDLMGQTNISTVQDSMDNIGKLTSGLVDMNNLVKLPM